MYNLRTPRVLPKAARMTIPQKNTRNGASTTVNITVRIANTEAIIFCEC